MIDVSYQRFGKLVALERAEYGGKGRPQKWCFWCADCGTKAVHALRDVQAGGVKCECEHPTWPFPKSLDRNGVPTSPYWRALAETNAP
jgi:hypothetical protein